MCPFFSQSITWMNQGCWGQPENQQTQRPSRTGVWHLCTRLYKTFLFTQIYRERSHSCPNCCFHSVALNFCHFLFFILFFLFFGKRNFCEKAKYKSTPWAWKCQSRWSCSVLIIERPWQIPSINFLQDYMGWKIHQLHSTEIPVVIEKGFIQRVTRILTLWGGLGRRGPRKSLLPIKRS